MKGMRKGQIKKGGIHLQGNGLGKIGFLLFPSQVGLIVLFSFPFNSTARKFPLHQVMKMSELGMVLLLMDLHKSGIAKGDSYSSHFEA